MSSSVPLEPRDDVSLVRDDLPFRLQRRVGLIPRAGGLGAGRRALFWGVLTWLPIAVWAWWIGRALPEQGQAVEPLLQHFGVHQTFAAPVRPWSARDRVPRPDEGAGARVERSHDAPSHPTRRRCGTPTPFAGARRSRA
jgi:hypothetical protein